jgi:hypothetical protein
MSDRITWHSESRKIAELNPAPYNPRYLTEKQAKDITNSLDEFGLADPIVINLNNTIIGGHQRINILKAQGVLDVDVRVPNRLLTEQEERRLNLRLNKNSGSWDFDALANFNDVSELIDLGFSEQELLGVDFNSNKSSDSDGAGPKSTITFTVTEDQLRTIKEALEKSKILCIDPIVSSPISRGSSLAFICKSFIKAEKICG